MSKEFTMFKELIEVLNKKLFNSLVAKYNSDYYIKCFSAWSHFMAMLYMQITKQESLRALELNFNHIIHTEKLTNISYVKRSTLADANQRRSPEFFQALCQHLLGTLRRINSEKSDIKEVIRLIDSTPIQLKGRGLDWAESTQRIQGIKAHFILDPNGDFPIYFSFTSAKVNDVVEAQKIIPVKGTILVFDRAYYDFAWWNEIDASGSTLVTRPKSTLAYKVVKKLDNDSKYVANDQEIKLTSKKRYKYTGRLRLVKAKVEIRGKIRSIQIITNNFKLSAEEIVSLYKRRWEIELFFKWIKQNLKVKKFISENENAIKIQIIMAIIAYILIKILQIRSGIEISMRRLIIFLRSHLFCKVKVYKYSKTEVTLPKILLNTLGGSVI